MEIIFCSKDNYKEYSTFVKSIYSVYPHFKDHFSHVVKEFLYKKSSFCKNAYISPVMVKQQGCIVAVCMYIIHKNYPGVLQVAFFEALENQQQAVDLIIDNAKKICMERGLNKIVIGLNGHVNYGIGFLCDRFQDNISFGSSFNPHYYPEYFLKYNPIRYKMVSFYGSMDTVSFEEENKMLQRIYNKFSYRNINFKNFRSEMKIYTDLNNICFKEHPFYFERDYEEDYELFKDLKYLIREENIIFALKDEKPIGYLMWYPDFNELLRNGEAIGVGTYVKNKLFPNKIKKFKIVEIAVLPQYQKSGAILGLFYECYKRTINRYTHYESSWIFEDNFKSRNFGVKWAESEFKHFVVFEILIEQTPGTNPENDLKSTGSPVHWQEEL